MVSGAMVGTEKKKSIRVWKWHGSLKWKPPAIPTVRIAEGTERSLHRGGAHCASFYCYKEQYQGGEAACWKEE